MIGTCYDSCAAASTPASSSGQHHAIAESAAGERRARLPRRQSFITSWGTDDSPLWIRTMTIDIATRPDIQIREALLPPYHVILHNDDVNDMLHVVQSLLRSVPSLTPPQAETIMLEAHLHGQAVVITCPLELAELYRERLESCGLTATIEKA